MHPKLLSFFYFFFKNACLVVACVWSNKRSVWRQWRLIVEVTLEKSSFIFQRVLPECALQMPSLAFQMQQSSPPRCHAARPVGAFGSVPGHIIATLEPEDAGNCVSPGVPTAQPSQHSAAARLGLIQNTTSVIFPFVQQIIRTHDMPRSSFCFGSSDSGGRNRAKKVIGKK